MSKKQPGFTSKIISSKRAYTWLWMYIICHYKNISIGELNSSGMNQSLDIASQEIRPQELLLQRKSSFLDISKYSWIKNDAFQLDWLSKILLPLIKRDLYTLDSEKIDRDYVIGLFDLMYSQPISFPEGGDNEYIRIRKEKQEKIVCEIRSKWYFISFYQKQFKWFNGEDESKKIAVGWQIFCNKVKDAKEKYNKFESLNELLNTFEMLQVSTENRKLFLIEVQARYRQNKWRAKKRAEPVAVKKTAKKSAEKIITRTVVERTINSPQDITADQDLQPNIMTPFEPTAAIYKGSLDKAELIVSQHEETQAAIALTGQQISTPESLRDKNISKNSLAKAMTLPSPEELKRVVTHNSKQLTTQSLSLNEAMIEAGLTKAIPKASQAETPQANTISLASQDDALTTESLEGWAKLKQEDRKR